MKGKWNIPRKLWNILEFKHFIMFGDVSVKRSAISSEELLS
jgi:hypothetical protein